MILQTKINIKNQILWTFYIISIFMSSPLMAQEKTILTKPEFKHALNICPIAPVFGIYALNYEYLFSPKNGMVARIEYEDVPKAYTDASIESNGWAFSLNYRRHFSGEMDSFFVGAYSRYRIYKGNGTLDTQNFDFDLPSVTLGLNAGKRWVWNKGFNLTISAGYGFSFDDRQATPSSNAIKSALDQLEKDYDFISPFFGELSIGYAF
jgi:hypothetical protein